MKVSTETIKNKKGQIESIEEFLYDKDNLVRQNYKDSTNTLKFFKTFEYDNDGNCILETEFNADEQLQGSTEHYFDDNKNEIKTIIKTDDGSIYEWYEQFVAPEDNLKVWLAKDPDGKINHRTEQDLSDNSEKRFVSSPES